MNVADLLAADVPQLALIAAWLYDRERQRRATKAGRDHELAMTNAKLADQ